MGIDPGEDAQRLRAYRREQGYPWRLYLGNPQILRDYRVASRSTKVAVDARGIIVYRAGYGISPPEVWERVFQELVGG